MRPEGSPKALEARRQLAVQRVLDGHDPPQVAEILGVSERSVWRWLAGHRRGGVAGLSAVPARGRPPKLTAAQERRVLSLVEQDARAFDFDTPRWTAPRLATVVERELGVCFNHRYLNDWLARRAVTPQLPQRVARERDEAAIEAWVTGRWPQIKKGRADWGQRWRSATRPGSARPPTAARRSPRAAARRS